MQLTDAQRDQVEANMGLVGKVIKDKVRDIRNLGIFDYNDLFQIGCIGLCEAVKTYKPDKTHFSTYAYILIRNEIFKAIEYATRRKKREPVMDPAALPGRIPSDTQFVELQSDVDKMLDAALARSSGTTAKGIRILYLIAQGYTCTEVSEQLHVPTNHVTAWVSRARKFLKSDPNISALRIST